MEDLLDLVVKLDKARVISRLKCKLWTQPRNFNSRPSPLCQSLELTIQDILKFNPCHRGTIEPIARKVQSLATLVTTADREGPESIHQNLKTILQAAGTLTGSDILLGRFLEMAGVQLTETNKKAIGAFDKVGNYWHLCQRLGRTAASRRYHSSVKSITLEFLEQYAKHKVNGNHRYVHAELQVAVFHRLQKTHPRPRAIGTSKAACYLYDLFLSQHPQYAFSATHGVLYEYWTIPDLIQYTSEDRRELQSVINFMYKEFITRAQLRNRLGLVFPAQSGIFQPPYLPSLTATTTSVSKSTERTNPAAIHAEYAIEGMQACMEPPEEQSRLEDTSSSVATIASKISNPSTLQSISSSAFSEGLPQVRKSHEEIEEPTQEGESLHIFQKAYSTQIGLEVSPAQSGSQKKL